jgi:hypothetical protein
MDPDTLELSPLLLKPYILLSIENLQKTVEGPQCLRKGYDLVRCGDVWDLKCKRKNGGGLSVSGWVHSELTSSNFYLATVDFSLSKLESFHCPCKGMMSRLCKHPVALLAALDAIRNAFYELKPPKRFRRVGMSFYVTAPDHVKDKVEADLTWEDVVKRFSEKCEKKRKHVTGYNKFISSEVLTKKQKRVLSSKVSTEEKVLRSRKVSELREECKRRNISCQGKKKEDLVLLLYPYFRWQSTPISTGTFLLLFSFFFSFFFRVSIFSPVPFPVSIYFSVPDLIFIPVTIFISSHIFIPVSILILIPIFIIFHILILIFIHIFIVMFISIPIPMSKGIEVLAGGRVKRRMQKKKFILAIKEKR